MKRVKFSRMKRTLRGKGFAIALFLSITAVGASTYLAYNQAISKIGGFENEEYTGTDIISFGNNDEDKPVDKTQQGIPINSPAETVQTTADTAVDNAAADIPAEEANNLIQGKAPRVMPVQGEIITPFSNGELVKSKTLGVWKTHDGADIAAEAGTPVVSMTTGTVQDIYSDPLWGVCVVIDHNDGIFGYYFGLDKSVAVIVGQEVGSGDTIGSVGNTAEIEIAEPSHLHFAVKKNNDWIDPVSFIG